MTFRKPREGVATIPAVKTRSIPSLDKALAVLEMLADARDGMTLPAIAEALEAPKSSVHCILLTLERRGYLVRAEGSRKYSISLQLVSLAGRALRGLAFQEQATPHLYWLSRATNCASHLAVLDQSEAVLIAKVEPPGSFRLATWVGRRMELHCTALGKVLMAALPDEELDMLLNQRSLSRHNQHTITSPRRLREEVDLVRSQGYSEDDEEDEIGLRCFAAPVVDASGATSAAISISGTTVHVNNDSREQFVAKLKEAAARISAAF
ncbi:MAG: helix-turn-helix domain-containing protein [Acidobacteria bacterium]|nr:helix-turn-helix domain-containing protein [Acidobacteriota bacterium]